CPRCGPVATRKLYGPGRLPTGVTDTHGSAFAGAVGCAGSTTGAASAADRGAVGCAGSTTGAASAQKVSASERDSSVRVMVMFLEGERGASAPCAAQTTGG